MAATVFEFGEFKLDSARFELTRAGRSLKLERKPLELLILLAARNGDLVTRAEIAERLWGSEVFVDTEHGINTAIRKVRQVLRDDSEEPHFIQTVTAKGYRFIATIVAVETPSAATRPALNDTPSPREASEAHPQTPSFIELSESKPAASRGSRFWIGLAAATALALLVTAITLRAHWSHTLAAIADIHSLAVLPLDNLSGDPGQNYFADGMTDELTTMLAKNSNLRIVSRTSALQYKDAHRPLREVAEALGVDGILEGSVERSAGKVHMTLQLIHAPSDSHLWADSYDRDANDVVTLPDEAAKTIAKRLNSAVPAATHVRYVNPEAHDAYLHGRYLWFAGQFDKAAEYFKKTTELQPDYAPGWSGLSMYYGACAVVGKLDPRQALVSAEATADKAIQLDDSLPEAHLVLGGTLFFHHWDWTGADHELLRAIELDPKFAEAYHLRSKLLGVLNRHEEAIESQKKAMEIDPFARPWALALSYQVARQYDAAITDIKQRLESEPNNPSLLSMLADVYRRKGMRKNATEALEQSLILSGDKAEADKVQLAFERGGYDAVLRWQISRMEGDSTNQYVSPLALAPLYAQLRQREKTLALLEEGYRQQSPHLLWIQCDPAYDFLHTDERYRSIIRGIGLPPTY